MSQNNPFTDAFKSFETFKSQCPAFDLKEAAEQARKNIEVFTEASKLLAEGAQAVAARQFEIAQANAENVLKSFKDVAASKDPKEAASKQASEAKKAVEKTIADANELVELASKSSNKAADLIGKQIAANIKDAKKAVAPKKKAAA